MKYWRHPWIGDVEYVADNMRRADAKECLAVGRTPKEALLMGYKHSAFCRTLVAPDGEPIAMVGVVPSEQYDEFGAIWLLGTRGIEKHGFRFLRYSKQALKECYEQTGYEAFYNATHKDNVVHHHWLKWLGFTFVRRLTIGNSGFIEFVRLKG